MIAIGIDPGLSGAVAVLHSRATVQPEVFDMPVMRYSEKGFVRNAVNAVELSDIIAPYAASYAGGIPVRVFTERLSAFPGQGVASMFSLGMSVGIVLGVVAGLGLLYDLVEPQVWKAHYRLTKDKETSLALARDLFPRVDLSKQKHHGRAEALLIAKYGLDLLAHVG